MYVIGYRWLISDRRRKYKVQPSTYIISDLETMRIELIDAQETANVISFIISESYIVNGTWIIGKVYEM